MYVLDWLCHFWNRIGQYFMRRAWFFGQLRVPAGNTRDNVETPLAANKVWFCVKSPRDLDMGDMDQASLGMVKGMPDGSVDVRVESPRPTKVDWFGHV